MLRLPPKRNRHVTNKVFGTQPIVNNKSSNDFHGYQPSLRDVTYRITTHYGYESLDCPGHLDTGARQGHYIDVPFYVGPIDALRLWLESTKGRMSPEEITARVPIYTYTVQCWSGANVDHPAKITESQFGMTVVIG